jgi:hypothetical protein
MIAAGNTGVADNNVTLDVRADAVTNPVAVVTVDA